MIVKDKLYVQKYKNDREQIHYNRVSQRSVLFPILLTGITFYLGDTNTWLKENRENKRKCKAFHDWLGVIREHIILSHKIRTVQVFKETSINVILLYRYISEKTKNSGRKVSDFKSNRHFLFPKPQDSIRTTTIATRFMTSFLIQVHLK